jgi:hypothetical protein
MNARIAGQDSTDFFGASVKEQHGLAAVTIQEQRMNGASLNVVDHCPEPGAPNGLANESADERKRLVPFRMKNGEAML